MLESDKTEYSNFVYKYGESIFKNMHSLPRLTSPESAVLTAYFYNKYFNLHPNSVEFDLIGNILYSDHEDALTYTSYNDLVEEYLSYDIHKLFGYTLDQFLNQTPAVANNLIVVAKNRLEKLYKARTAYKNQQDKEVNKSTGNIVMDDILDF